MWLREGDPVQCSAPLQTKFPLKTKRHDAILQIGEGVHAPASIIVRINQAVPGADEFFRPDLVAVDEACKTVAIENVTMPFENRYAAFQAARIEKQLKYAPLADHYKQQTYSVCTLTLS